MLIIMIIIPIPIINIITITIAFHITVNSYTTQLSAAICYGRSAISQTGPQQTLHIQVTCGENKF